MEIHQLRYFVAVAEVESFGGAARRCHIAQSSLSQQIMKLEQELGCRLFDRMGRSIALTAAGSALLPRARRILGDVQQISDDLPGEIEPGRGSLSVGAIPTMAPYLLPPAIEIFKRQWPKAKLTIHEDHTDRIVDSIVRAEIDIGVTSTPIRHESVDVRVLYREPLLVAVPVDSPLDGSRQLTIKDLKSYPTVFLDQVHCLGQQVHDFCRAMRIQPSVVCEAIQLSTAHRLVGLGLGICLMPQMFADIDTDPRVRYIRIKGDPPAREIAVITMRARTMSRLAATFVEALAAGSPGSPAPRENLPGSAPRREKKQ